MPGSRGHAATHAALWHHRGPWGAAGLAAGACSLSAATSPRPSLLTPPSPFPSPRTRGRLWFHGQDSVRASHTSFININSLKNIFFSVLFTICFFPWLKIIGNETLAAWGPPRRPLRRNNGTDNDCIFPSEQAAVHSPRRLQTLHGVRWASHPVLLVLCLLRAPCLSGAEHLFQGVLWFLSAQVTDFPPS